MSPSTRIWSASLLCAAALLAPVRPARADSRSAATASAAEPSAAELLRDSDRARGGLEDGITWTVTLESSEDGVRTSKTFLVKARGNDALVETTAPSAQKGEIMLFNDRTIWYTKPGLRKPVSISARQRLSGQAANGDIAATNYRRDYEGHIVGQTRTSGVDAYLIELKARAKNVTYDQIRYWIAKDTHLGIKAQFLTLSGSVMKTATFEYGNKLDVNGHKVPFVSRMTITDALSAGNVTVLRYAEPRPASHPASLFNINNVVR